MQNVPARTFRWFFSDVVGEFFMAPVWWYSHGMIRLLDFVIKKLKEHEEKLGIIMWTKSLFLPMYAQRDWQGRVISFFVRCVFLIVKLAIFSFWILWYGVLVVVFLVMPFVIVWQIIYQLSA